MRIYTSKKMNEEVANYIPRSEVILLYVMRALQKLLHLNTTPSNRCDTLSISDK